MSQILVLLPPIIAIGLALLTKEVYSSLFIGVVVGAFLFVLSGGATIVDPIIVNGIETVPGFVQGFFVVGEHHTAFAWNFSIMGTIDQTYQTIVGSIANETNVGILIFLVLLGMLVALVTRAGGSKSYGEWASGKIKTRVGALLATSALGAMIFVDDYFNCLTVGTVMKPVTDKHKISRAKLAYIIDSTAAPICIIAPISSWAAAITSSFPEGAFANPFTVFLQTIPFNFYALLTLVFLVAIIVMKVDYGPMKQAEDLANEQGELGGIEDEAKTQEEIKISDKGRVFDLIIPIAVLIVCAILGMIYTGGGFDGVDLITAFSECDSIVSLNMGAMGGLLASLAIYLPRKIMTAREYMGTLAQGFKAMVPAITILALAWSLGSICKNYLLLGDNIAVLFSNTSVLVIVPCIMFVVAGFIGFSTGTSWGTMAILIPLVAALFGAAGGDATTIVIISVAAVASGAVLGDHVSPISDTTIMASTGAQCNHLQHVTTQMPYALTVAVVAFIGFLVAGLTSGLGYGLSLAISLGTGLLLLFGVLCFIKYRHKKATSK